MKKEKGGNKHVTKPARIKDKIPVADETVLRPFIKWAGGKSGLLDDIRRRYPCGLGDSIRKYAEPFVGSGAVLFDILKRYELDEVYIGDVNSELINTYISIRDELREVEKYLSSYQDIYRALDTDGRKKFYYERRTDYNMLKRKDTREALAECAAMFIFLNKTCFNGLYRVNSNGDFNVPAGRYKNPTIYDGKLLYAISEAIQDVKIVREDYRASADFIDDKTFVYFDPPYRPITETAYFTSYTASGFDDCDQRRLADFVKQLGEKGARILVSNSDPKNSDANDDFFERLYNGFTIDRVSALRMINRDASKRGKISELLVYNYDVRRCSD
jgi:DNA adenine methylase